MIPLILVHPPMLRPIRGWALLVCFVAWVVAMVMASRRKMFRIPILGVLAERLAKL